jgi:acetyl/propionyl-CoA carboxylase alpha subunit/acetyl-CoA carboxylase carboxyltransferase component
MGLQSVLIANRGEVAVRVARAGAQLGLRTVAVYSTDDAASLHTRAADEAVPLARSGPAAYLDVEALVSAALDCGCDAVHPGYGFLSESAAFARACADAGLVFVGPRAETLEVLGDKAEARALAGRLGVPVLAGTPGPATLDEAARFLESLGEGGAVMLKAVAGGGGRGMRPVGDPTELAAAYERCRSEAQNAFGSGAVYVEQLLGRARHVEVQVVGDGTGAVSHLGERECTLQRRFQKVVEWAPAPTMAPSLVEQQTSAAVAMAESLRYLGLGTFEFLVDDSAAEPVVAFIEANPRLQVEHTVTEEVTGVDLVAAQLQLAAGDTLADLGLTQDRVPAPRGFAVQARVNLESIGADGTPLPSGGRLTAFEPPAGPGVRTDTFGYAGYVTSPSFDPLLAKVVAHAPAADHRQALARLARALEEFRIDGVVTNLGFLQQLVAHPDVAANRVHTRFIEQHAADWAGAVEPRRARWFAAAAVTGAATAAATATLAGARIDTSDPLAVLDHGRSPHSPGAEPGQAPAVTCDRVGPDASIGGGQPDGMTAVLAPLQGTVVAIDVAAGDLVHAGQQLLVMEAMKMEHVIVAPAAGRVAQVTVVPGDAVFADHLLVLVEDADVEAAEGNDAAELDLDDIRPDLAEVLDRHAAGLDPARPDAVARRRRTGQRTARENVEDICDEGSFVEYGPLVLAAQRRRRSEAELIAKTPADGLLAGVGRVNGHLFDAETAQCVVMAYDYTVLAGTQGQQNHRKKDRMFELAAEWRLPVVFFTEGGGGRPGDTDGVGVAGLDCWAFNYWGRLSGLVPLVGINSGRCFAGNAALLGCCDVVIATAGSNIGMGGPAMIEGGGLGIFRPEEVGPLDIQVRNGVVDVAVADEAEAVAVAKQYLSYFQGPLGTWDCADQRLLRSIIPENRLRIYDVRRVVETLADSGCVLELRRHFGPGMVTSLIRIEGRPVGVVANNPAHLAGAIDSDGADKAARFMQLCDAFDVPILFLCDTPGIMVGPEVEKTALVRHAARMFVTGASVTVPFFTIVLRKGYGLGAQAMAGGSFKAPFFTVAWPTGEFGGMGLEGAVKLGYRDELAALDDPAERKALFDEMVERMYRHGKAVSTASHFEIDDVIDPHDSRAWIMSALTAAPPRPRRRERKRPCVDTW